MIGLTISRQVINQSEVKPNPNRDLLAQVFRASYQLHVITSRFDLLCGLFLSFVVGLIGHSENVLEVAKPNDYLSIT